MYWPMFVNPELKVVGSNPAQFTAKALSMRKATVHRPIKVHLLRNNLKEISGFCFAPYLEDSIRNSRF